MLANDMGTSIPARGGTTMGRLSALKLCAGLRVASRKALAAGGRSLAVLSVLLSLIVVAPRPAAAQDPIKVVATTAMIADAARAVGGMAVEVVSLMGPGIDPHSYRQTRSDIVKLTQADVVLWNGFYLEAQLQDLLTSLAARKPGSVVAVAEFVPAERRLPDDEFPNRYDPHVWMDPDLWSLVVSGIERVLQRVRPEAADQFAANAGAYRAELAALQQYAAEVLGTVPLERRLLVTAHDAFGYFGRAYGFEVVGIQGLSTESEAGVARIRELVDLIVERRIAAVFVEASVSDRNMRAVIEGAAARGHNVRIGAELFSDSMGEPGTYEGSYVGMIDHNVSVIAAALGGRPPLAGRLGRLAPTMIAQ